MIDYINAVIKRLKLGWCRGVLATNAEGHEVDINNPHAANWCLVGAMCIEDPGNLSYRDLSLALQDKANGSIVKFNNDQETVEPVIAFLETCLA